MEKKLTKEIYPCNMEVLNPVQYWDVLRRPECTTLANINMSMCPDYFRIHKWKNSEENTSLFLLTAIKINQDMLKESDLQKIAFLPKYYRLTHRRQQPLCGTCQ